MANYNKIKVANDARVELHDSLNLTGAEISINSLPSGAVAPFAHSHKKNEEIYLILSGKGNIILDGESIELESGDCLRVSPAAVRQLNAAKDSSISYICIQVKEGSLEGFTMTDGVIVK